MKEQLMKEIERQMLTTLSNGQMERLRETLVNCLARVSVYDEIDSSRKKQNSDCKLLESFIAAKRIEGCSEKSLKYYATTIDKMIKAIDKPIVHIMTDDLR